MNPKTKITLTKKLLAIILAATIAFTVISIYVYGNMIQTATNKNTMEIEGDLLYIYSYDGVTIVDGDTINWGTVDYGINIKQLNVTNIHTKPIRVFLYYSELPEGCTLSWTGNKTLLDTTEPYKQIVNNAVLMIADTAQPGVYSFNTTLYATEIT